MCIVVTNRPLRFAQQIGTSFVWTDVRALATDFESLHAAEKACRRLGGGQIVEMVDMQQADPDENPEEIAA